MTQVFFYGHATIALTEANSNHEEIAQEHLNIISQAEFIDEDTALVANLARASIALRNFDLDTARQRIDTATLLNPNHPLIQHYEDLFSELLDENKLEKDEEITNERDYGDLF